MALSDSVNESLTEASQSLRNELAFASLGGKSYVCKEIAEMIHKIEGIREADKVLDMLDKRKEGDSGIFGSFFD